MKINLTSYDLYSDGGVIHKNPSSLGGTYAFMLVQNNKIKYKDFGYILPAKMGTPVVTNNQTELLAILSGVYAAQYQGWGIRCIYSDSQVTLGRLFQGWALNNIPAWLVDFKNELTPVYKNLKWELVRGHADNKWNNECDRLCHRAADEFLAKGK